MKPSKDILLFAEKISKLLDNQIARKKRWLTNTVVILLVVPTC